MTDRTATPTSGKFFVNYLIFGIVSLLIAMTVGRLLVDSTSAQKFFLSGSIVVVNLVTVWLYSAAVLRNKDLRADPDAPDLAYYLGFSLTVGALAFSFLGDIKLGGEGGSQVQNALGQFGAGLLATLFGLCAKIYLASRQAQEFSDPENLYLQLRGEVTTLRDTLRETGADLASSVELSSERIKAAGLTATQAMTQLATDLSAVQQQISRDLSPERISGSINAFVDALTELRGPANAVAGDVVALTRTLQSANDSVSEMAEKSREVSNLHGAHLQLGKAHQEVLSEGVQSNKLLIESQERITTQIEQSADALQVLTLNIGGLGTVLPQVTETLTGVGERAKPAAEQLVLLANATQSVLAPAHNLSSVIGETTTNLGALNTANQSMAQMVSQGAEGARSLRLALDTLVEGTRAAETAIARLTPTFGGNTEQAQNLQREMLRLGAIFSQVVANATDLQTKLNESTLSMGRLSTNVETAMTALRATPDAIDGFKRPLDSMAATTVKLNEGLSNLTTQAADSARALRQVSDVERR
jgi:chromosome segregation ATPase